jgi:hypothetical protein
MILWRLRGHADPEAERVQSEVVCSIEGVTTGYRLLVEHGGTVQMDEMHQSATAAQEKAEALRAELVKQGWTPA